MKLFTTAMMFLLMFATNMLYAETKIKPRTSVVVSENTEELITINGIHDSTILIKKTIICEINVRISPKAPTKLYSFIVNQSKMKCPLVRPQRIIKPHNPNPERPA